MSSLNLPEPPDDACLRRRARTPRLQSLTLQLKTITPILGGGPVARQLPEVDIIRVPTLRGHLRFWWRALYGHELVSDGEKGRQELARRERELWGGMGAGEEHALRSQVELRVTGVQPAGKDEGPIKLGTPPAYALWTARNPLSEESDVPRWKKDLQFTLELLAPEGEALRQAHQALRAWLLFGGYGSRTRRGCGSVTLLSAQEREAWLPRTANLDELRRLFSDVPLFEPEHAGPPCDMPLLRGAWLYRGARNAPYVDATEAWLEALGWLREFRQGISTGVGRRSRESLPARNPARDIRDNRAGRSNWPEADKIRHHAQPSPKTMQEARRRSLSSVRAYPEVHAPRSEYTASPAWPRAGFGLPIVVHFQQQMRQETRDAPKQPYWPPEPEHVQLQWEDGKHEVKDRLASPLIVKALPLANGRFEPVALWLERSYPEKGGVVLMQRGKALPGTRADFDRLRAPGDKPLFWPLQRECGLREAFFEWLEDNRKARRA